MKMRLFLFNALMACFLSTYSQRVENSIIINGKIEDSSMTSNDVQILYNKLFTENLNLRYFKQYDVKIIDGTLHLVINEVLPKGYMRILLPRRADPLLESSLMVMPGDEINFTSRNGKVVFTGKDAAKFNCQFQASLVPVNEPPCKGDVMDSVCFQGAINAFDRNYEEKMVILKQFRQRIGEKMYSALKFDYKYKREFSKLYRLYTNLIFSDSVSRVNTTRFYDKYVKLAGLDTLREDKLGLNSNTYADFLFIKELCDLNMPAYTNRSGIINSSNKQFNNIVSKYTGKLRDHILTRTLNLSQRDSTDFYLFKAMEVVTDPVCKSILKKMLSNVKGVEAYDFKLRDTANRIVTLNEFKGKVVVMDFYFTGCLACTILRNSLNPVYDHFKDNPNLVFVTVDIDKSREMFKKAVKSQIYTHPRNIDLYTNGEGEKHEIMEHYGFQGAPHLILIDKNGKISEVNPSFKQTGEHQGFISQITSLINH